MKGALAVSGTTMVGIPYPAMVGAEVILMISRDGSGEPSFVVVASVTEGPSVEIVVSVISVFVGSSSFFSVAVAVVSVGFSSGFPSAVVVGAAGCVVTFVASSGTPCARTVTVGARSRARPTRPKEGRIVDYGLWRCIGEVRWPSEATEVALGEAMRLKAVAPAASPCLKRSVRAETRATGLPVVIVSRFEGVGETSGRIMKGRILIVGLLERLGWRTGRDREGQGGTGEVKDSEALRA
jgi:hypothetical protein